MPLRVTLNFICLLCQNKNNFYIMPLDEKTSSGDYIHSNEKWRIVCKKCGQNHLIKFNYEISTIERKK